MASSIPKRHGLYAGSFDPFTNGHLDICRRAIKIFDELTILLAVSPSKKPLLPEAKRKSLIEAIFKDEPRVKVESWPSLTVQYAEKNGIDAIVRGLRPTGDFDTEFQMAAMNRKLNPAIETVFFVSDERFSYISSTLVKEIFQHGGDVSEFVPPEVAEELNRL